MSEKVALKRELGLFEVTLSGVGIILGAGIYTLIGRASGLVTNGEMYLIYTSILISSTSPCLSKKNFNFFSI